MANKSPIKLRTMVGLAGLAILAGCAAPVVEPPPPAPTPTPTPPPPPPARPIAPVGVADNYLTPPIGANGVRQTVNTNLTTAHTVWNLRSGWNVAVFNCTGYQSQTILDGYSAFLGHFKTALSQTNRTLDQEYRARYGSTYRSDRDSYMTKVYNYFALPPARNNFCDTAYAISNEFIATKPATLDAYAITTLPRLEAAFERFYTAYDQYKIDVALWDAAYGTSNAPIPSSLVDTTSTFGGSPLGTPATAGDALPGFGSTVVDTAPVPGPTASPPPADSAGGTSTGGSD